MPARRETARRMACAAALAVAMLGVVACAATKAQWEPSRVDRPGAHTKPLPVIAAAATAASAGAPSSYEAPLPYGGKFLVSRGLEGARVLGALYFNGHTPNWFDAGFGYGMGHPADGGDKSVYEAFRHEHEYPKEDEYNAGYEPDDDDDTALPGFGMPGYDKPKQGSDFGPFVPFKRNERGVRIEAYKEGKEEVEYGYGQDAFPDAPVVAAISAKEQPQFAYAGPVNQITVDITSIGAITIKQIVKKAGVNSPVDIILHSKAFAGYSIERVNATAPLEFTAWPSGPETIRFSVPAINFTDPGTYTAEFKLYACVPPLEDPSLPTCCTLDGEAAGLCDQVEKCSGRSGDCPADKLRPEGALCAPVTSPCVLPSTCDGDSPQCGAPEQRQPGDKCPWFPGCTDCSPLDSVTPDQGAMKRKAPRKSAAQAGIASADKPYDDDSDTMHWPMCSGVCTDESTPTLKCIKTHRGPGCCYYSTVGPYQAEAAMVQTAAVRHGYTKSDDSDYEHGGPSHKKTLVCWA